MILDPSSILSILLFNPFILATALLSLCCILSMVLSAILLPSQRASRYRLPILAAILAVVASLIPNPYWTFSLEALGWAGLAYASLESTPKEDPIDNINTTAIPTMNESSTNDSGSQTTVSAEAEDAYEDVLIELKTRFIKNRSRLASYVGKTTALPADTCSML